MAKLRKIIITKAPNNLNNLNFPKQFAKYNPFYGLVAGKDNPPVGGTWLWDNDETLEWDNDEPVELED